MVTILWCYLRNSASRPRKRITTSSADLTGQANHLGVTIEADIIKQKLPENNGGYKALTPESPYGKIATTMYTELCTRPSDRSDAGIRSPIVTWAAAA